LDTKRCVWQRFETGFRDGLVALRAKAILTSVEARQGLIDLVELGRGLAIEVITDVRDLPELRIVVLPLGHFLAFGGLCCADPLASKLFLTSSSSIIAVHSLAANLLRAHRVNQDGTSEHLLSR
jgi:hypothetical protein